ncbi:MAG: YdcF family protein [Fervidobacterium sp.]
MIHLFKIIGPFFTIPGIFVTVFLMLFFYFKFAQRERKVSYLFLIFGIILYVVSSSWFGYILSKVLTVDGNKDIGTYIVVLGGGIDQYSGSIEIGKHTLRRLYTAVELYKKKPRKILVTGGIIDKGVPEALVMRDVLLNFGIPNEDIIVEKNARNTYENAKYTYQILGDVPITLVTSTLHMKRSLIVFKKFYNRIGWMNSDVPLDFRNSYLDYLPSINGFYAVSNATHEILGILQYLLVYR